MVLHKTINDIYINLIHAFINIYRRLTLLLHCQAMEQTQGKNHFNATIMADIEHFVASVTTPSAECLRSEQRVGL